MKYALLDGAIRGGKSGVDVAFTGGQLVSDIIAERFVNDWTTSSRLFDVGHGFGSFSYEVARTALGQGFQPHTISSDLHRYNIDGPVFDLQEAVGW